MINFMVTVSVFGLMEINILVSGEMAKRMVLVNVSISMETNTLASGKITNAMGMVNSFASGVINIMGGGKTINNMEWGALRIQMDMYILVCTKMEKKMVYV